MDDMRRVSRQERKEAEKLWRAIFQEDGEALVRHYFDDRKDQVEIEGLFSEDVLTSVIHLNSYQVFFRDILYDIRYIVGVATDKKYQREGRMSRLMAHCLRKLYEEGDVFTVLMPVDSAYYTPFGFRFIQDVDQYRFKAPETLAEMTLKPVKEDNVAVFVPAYYQAMKKHPLHVNRGMHGFDILKKELAAEGGELIGIGDGYLAVYDDDDLQVREAVYQEPETLKSMFSYVSERAGKREIHWQMPTGSPLKNLVDHRAGNMVIRQPFIMARILNAYELISDMAECFEDCSILISDKLIMENNGLYAIRSGIVHKEKATSADEADIALSVEALTQWLFGYETLETLEGLYDDVVINNPSVVIDFSNGANYFNEFI